MKKVVERHKLRSPFRVGYVFAAPVVLLAALYFSIYLLLNSGRGSEVVSQALKSVVAGKLELGYIEVGRDLLSVRLHDARLSDPAGQPVIEARYLTCSFDPQGLARRQVHLDNCLGRDGRVLVAEYPDGDMGVVKAIQGNFRPKKPRGKNPTSLLFTNITLRNIDVLVNISDLMIRFDGVNIDGGSVESGRDHIEIRATAQADSGRMLMTERLFSLGEGKSSWEMVEYEILRRARPWIAAQREVPVPPEGERGYLELPLRDIQIERFRWLEEDFTVGRLAFRTGADSFDAGGYLRMIPERPKVPKAEKGIIYYDGTAKLALQPDSPIFQYFLPGVFSAMSGPGLSTVLEPLVFQGYGSVRFYDGATRVKLTDVGLLDWRIEELDAGISWDNGTMVLSPDSFGRIWGGSVRGRGFLVPATGVYELELCADKLQFAQAAAPWIPNPASDVGRLADFTLSTATPTFELGVPAGIVLRGDLTMKALEVDPAATTPLDKEIQPPMLNVFVQDVALNWAQSPPFFPRSSAQLDASGTLTQRGEVLLGTKDAPGVRLQTGSDRLELAAELDFPNAMLRNGVFEGESSDIGAWLRVFDAPLIPEGASATARVEFAGPFDAPEIGNVSVEANKPRADEVLPQFHLQFRGRGAGSSVLVESASFGSTFGAVSARGSVQIFGDSVFHILPSPAFDLEVQLNEIDTAELLADFPLETVLDGEFHLGGRPGALEVSGDRFEIIDSRIFGEPVDYVAVDGFFLSNTHIRANGFLLAKGKGSVQGRVDLNLSEKTMSLLARGRKFRLREFRIPREAGLFADGTAEFQLSMEGPFRAPDVAGSLVVENLEVSNFDVGSIALTFDTFDQVIELAGVVASDLNIDASIPTNGDPWRVSGWFDEARIEDHVRSLRKAIDRSAATGTFDFWLDPFGEKVYSAQLNLNQFQVDIASRTFDIRQPAMAEWDAQTTEDGTLAHQVRLQGLQLGSGGRYLSANGGIRVANGTESLGLAISGDSDFSLLRFLPDLIVDAEGPARVMLKLSGSLSAPSVQGTVEFESARIAPRGLGTDIYLYPGKLFVTSDAITVKDDVPLNGTVFGGDFSIFGEIGLRRLIPNSVDFRGSFYNLAYRIPQALNITLTSDGIRFRAGELADYNTWSLTGSLDIVDARYYDDIDIGSISFGSLGGSRSVDEFSLPVWQRVAAIGATRADLQIRGRDKFLVESTIANAEMDLEFRTNLQLTGPFSAMTLIGEMEALSGGTVSFRGRKFDLQSGTLIFRGARDPDGYPMPVLEAELETSVEPCNSRSDTTTFDTIDASSRSIATAQAVAITSYVRGQLPYDLTFELESVPSYDQRDQLSMILTGCTLDELTASAAGGRGLEVVLRPVIDAVERNVEGRLELDNVDVAPTASGSTGITIQDQVSERFTWTFDAVLGAGTETRQLARGEFRLFDWLSVELQEQTKQQESLTIDGGFRFRVRLD